MIKNITIRMAKMSDVDKIFRLYKFSHEGVDGYNTRNGVRMMIKSGCYFIALHKNVVVGIMTYRVSDMLLGFMYDDWTFVFQEYENMGIATKLAECGLREWGHITDIVTDITNAKLIPLYARCGFYIMDVNSDLHHYRKLYGTSIRMRRDRAIFEKQTTRYLGLEDVVMP